MKTSSFIVTALIAIFFCFSARAQAQSSKAMQMNPPSVVQPGASYLDMQVDISGKYALFSLPALRPGGPVSIVWNFGDGNVITTSGNFASHTYTASGEYLVRCEVYVKGSDRPIVSTQIIQVKQEMPNPENKTLAKKSIH